MNREELIGLRRQIQKVLEEGRAFPAEVLSAQIVLAFEKAQNARDLPKSDIAGGGISLSEHTPTDDELLDTYRDAVDLAMHRANMRDGFASNMSRESIVAGLRAVARFRRSEQGEPTVPDGWFPFGSHAPYPWVGRMEFSDEKDDAGMPRWERPVQGEPSDAALDAALDAWFRAVDEGEYSRDAMHAALRAAAATQTGENR